MLLQEKKSFKYISFILKGIGIYTLLPFLLHAFYIHPAADDFWFAIRDTTLSFFASQKEYYLTWSGRYFATAIVRINPLTFESYKVYKLYSFGLLLLFCSAILFLVYTTTNKVFDKKKVVDVAALLLILYLLQMPSPVEGFYFFSTYAAYQVGSILLILMLSMLNVFFNTIAHSIRLIAISAAALLCVCIIGANEMAMIMTFTTVLFITLHNLKNTSERPYLLFLFLVCVCCCLVAVLAPGNFVRMENHPNANKFWWSAVYAFLLTGLTFYRWLLPVLIISIVYAVYYGIPVAGKLKHSRLFQVDFRLAVLYVLATIYLMNFLFAWSIGERPTPRLENVIYFFFLFGWFYVLQVAICRFYKTFLSEVQARILPAVAMGVFLLYVLGIENNISTAYVDLISGKAAAYNQALNQRYRLLAASDCTSCAVPPLPAIPATIYFSDLLAGPENKNWWINRGFANYLGKAGVYLSAPNPPIMDNLTTLRSGGKKVLHQEKIIE